MPLLSPDCPFNQLETSLSRRDIVYAPIDSELQPRLNTCGLSWSSVAVDVVGVMLDLNPKAEGIVGRIRAEPRFLKCVLVLYYMKSKRTIILAPPW